VAWRHKLLWVYGLFAGGGASFNFDFSNFLDDSDSDVSDAFRDLGLNMPVPDFSGELIAALLLIAMGLFLVYIVAHFISIGALIDAGNRITRGGVYTFGSAFSAGLDYFWRFLGLGIMAFIVMFSFFLIWIFFIVLPFFIHWSVGIVALLILLPAGFVAGASAYNIYSLAQRAMVARNGSISQCLEEAFFLFKTNFGANVMIFLIFVGLEIAFTIVVLMILGVISIPIIALVAMTDVSIIGGVLLGLVLAFPVSLAVGGFVGAAFTNLYTFFYFELVEPGGRQQVDAGPEPQPAG
jgi:hypothetical protein